MKNFIEKKVIAITGSNKGLGLGMVKSLCETNEFYVVLTSRNKDIGQKIWGEIIEKNADLREILFFHDLDISCKVSREKFFLFIEKTFKKIDILVNNAGIFIKNNVFNLDAYDKTFSSNFFGTVDITEEMIANNLIREGGKVIFISSSYGKVKKIKKEELRKEFMKSNLSSDNLMELAMRFRSAIANNTVDKEGWCRNIYSVSKLCLSLYADVLSRRKEIYDKSIHVFSCCPGWVRTDMGGPTATRTVEEGIRTPLFLIKLKNEMIEESMQGKFFYDEKIVDFNQ